MVATLGLVALSWLGLLPQSPAQDSPKGLKEISRLKEDFNKDKGRVRLMFIFSPS